MINIPEFTVSEFSTAIKTTIEDSFGYVRIKGEISGFKKATSGHLYFSLKDENSLLTAVFFRNMANAVNFEIEDGLEVIASGKITTYQGRSNYQIIVEKLEISGIGAILELIEKRRKKLFEEGLFDEKHKKPLPFFPKKIGIITSKTGAVIEDIKNKISNRCPTNLVIYPVSVQGKTCSIEIIQAIRFFNNLSDNEKPELLIIARGGGSIEDLMPFNDEELVREVFKSKIVIISAVGHETDFTLIDYVADLRASTPTSAGELATPIFLDLQAKVNYFEDRIKKIAQGFLEKNYEITKNLQKRLNINLLIENKFNHLNNLQKRLISPQQVVANLSENLKNQSRKFDLTILNFFEKLSKSLYKVQFSNGEILQKITTANQKLEFLLQKIEQNIKNKISNKENSLQNLEKILQTTHYDKVLERGFSLIRNEKGNIISSILEIKQSDNIKISVYDGMFEAKINKITNNENS